jgi:anaerobic selenocysteine-containing dehydrogenase
MTSRRIPHVFNSPSLATLRDRVPFNPAYMHPDDLESLGLETGDRVEVRSARAAIEAIAQADDTLRRGIVSISHNWGGPPQGDGDVEEIGANSGRLIANDVDFDPFSGQPRMSNVPVNVRPA